ncbi:OmpH family outer membrane protein [Candidatus Venteria ishoeyi]|uniref:Chaperone protein Skp n=1 Tax=Candidatus Venteria ishoeyi TaxID=1899563 RepID=A0A1H6FAB5_9GAMM|nr:OmpH family outer membrane protein [Candidatus Venteria ishoeyi]MDM8547988.1 OmpH family outer membrane protein [Candidatus Venteria ishoeyi]SEH05945.1 Chaperone protein Skp precursor [Candidatus Venteria ishoeyi]
MNKKHPIFMLTLMSILLLPVSNIHAADIKIGFVNILQVLDMAPQAKTADARLKQEFAPREKRLTRIGDEIRRMESRLQKEEDIMSAKEVTRLSKQVRSKSREFEREKDELSEDFNLRRNEEIAKLQKQIYKAIVSLSEAEGYDLVVGEGVIHASKRVDITNKVLGQLKKMK